MSSDFLGETEPTAALLEALLPILHRIHIARGPYLRARWASCATSPVADASALRIWPLPCESVRRLFLLRVGN